VQTSRNVRIDAGFLHFAAMMQPVLLIFNHNAKFVALSALGFGGAQISRNPHLNSLHSIASFISRSAYFSLSSTRVVRVWENGLRCVVDIATSA
jgi:hypothetical protein